MTKRVRIPPEPKEGRIDVRWGREYAGQTPSLVYSHGPGPVGMRATSLCVMDAFHRAPVLEGKSLVQLLQERGYDLTTLRFSIDKLPEGK